MAKEFDILPEEVKATQLRTSQDYITSSWDIIGEIEELIVAMEEMSMELQRSLEEENAKGKENSKTINETEDEPGSRRRSSVAEPPVALPQIQTEVAVQWLKKKYAREEVAIE
ncbi:unnamed protein product [Heligmosomoides polygyrus]|uniref:Ty3-gypsy retrotransposon protein n=1 Tax=Heligmosomoides polygyrus TaxID=6339 RepID=A0A183G0X5_HELPZ|nr:unnamed protein product [Heligmosomoides polygyrus]